MQDQWSILIIYCFILKLRTNKLSNEVKKRGSGFSKLCSLSPQLQEFIGVSEMARTEVHLISCGDVAFQLYFNLLLRNCHWFNLSILLFVCRLWSKCGHILERKICKTQVISGLYFVMSHCVLFLVLIPLTCSKWIRPCQSIFGLWTLTGVCLHFVY